MAYSDTISRRLCTPWRIHVTHYGDKEIDAWSTCIIQHDSICCCCCYCFLTVQIFCSYSRFTPVPKVTLWELRSEHNGEPQSTSFLFQRLKAYFHYGCALRCVAVTEIRLYSRHHDPAKQRRFRDRNFPPSSKPDDIFISEFNVCLYVSIVCLPQYNWTVLTISVELLDHLVVYWLSEL